MNPILEHPGRILMETAVVERLRRNPEIALHPTLANAPLIYDPTGAAALSGIYREYIAIAAAAGMPILLCTPTWRANAERVAQANMTRTLNRDAGHFMQQIRQGFPQGEGSIRIGGMIGCKNDCYRPEQGLSAADASDFHAWQIDELAQAGVDFLIAVTLPNVDEALGMAQAMGKSGLPYLVSFVISQQGRVLDGSRLLDAIDRIDADASSPPYGYLVNCIYPTFLCAPDQPPRLFTRLIGCQANASSLDPRCLEGADQVMAEPISRWGNEMMHLSLHYGMRILGGCCGTGPEHLAYLADQCTERPT